MKNWINIKAIKKSGVALGLVLATSISGAASASESFWQMPSQRAVTASADDGTQYSAYSSNYQFESELGLQENRFASTDWANLEESRVSSFGMSQMLGESSQLMMQYAKGVEQRNMVMGFRQQNLTVSMMRGDGATISELGGQYSGINPFQFHGGIQHNYDYDGMAFDYRFDKIGHLQYGQAEIKAFGLQDRAARYFQWAGDRAYARFTSFERGAERIGNGLDLGYAFSKAMVGFQAFDLENDKRFQRLRFEFDRPKQRKFLVDLFASQNPLYRDSDDVGVMLSWSGTLGGGASYYAQQEEAEGSVEPDADPNAKPKKKKRGISTRMLLIGVGVAAGAAMASSGSDSQDNSGRFFNKDDAAKDVLDRINPTSIRENREYGGWIFLNQDGSYAATQPSPGDNDSVQLPSPRAVIPVGSVERAIYHTHAAFDPRYDNENFSQTDLDLDRRLGLDGYLGTPGGLFKLHDIETDTVITLGRVRTE